MPNHTFVYLDHNDIIEFMQALGYESCDDGVCYGFAVTGLASVLRKDWERFNSRLRWMTIILDEIHARSLPRNAPPNDIRR